MQSVEVTVVGSIGSLSQGQALLAGTCIGVSPNTTCGAVLIKNYDSRRTTSLTHKALESCTLRYSHVISGPHVALRGYQAAAHHPGLLLDLDIF